MTLRPFGQPNESEKRSEHSAENRMTLGSPRKFRSLTQTVSERRRSLRPFEGAALLPTDQQWFTRPLEDLYCSDAYATVYMTVAGARRFQGIRPQSVYIKDQPFGWAGVAKA